MQNPSRTSRARRRLIGALVVIAMSVAGYIYLTRDPMPRFTERRSSLASVVVGDSIVDPEYILTPVRVTATSGLAVDLMFRRPRADSDKRLPLAVILGGHYTGRKAVDLLGPTPGVAIAALSYPFTGDPRPDALTFLREIPKIRGAFLDTPPAVMLALDYLWQLPAVDTAQVEAIGVSLGAPFMTIAGALDPRLSRVWVLHGSGGSYVPLEANMKRNIPIPGVRHLAAGLANVIINGPRLDPVHWVDDIAPRPFMMVNASDDERLPRRAVDALYESAQQPKEIVWMPGRHIHSDRETIQKLVTIVMDRMRQSPAGSGRVAHLPSSERAARLMGWDPPHTVSSALRSTR